MARVLILAPHPDDEVIGCAGLIQRVKEEGGQIYVRYVTVGNTADWSSSGVSTTEERFEELRRVVELLKVDGYDLAYPGDGHHLRLDRLPQVELIDLLERSGPLSIATLRPTAVVIPSAASYNQDHQAVARAAMAALRPVDPLLRCNPACVLSFEQLADAWTDGGTTTMPNVFIELGEHHVETKLAAMRLYRSQWREAPHSRSDEALKALASIRGCQTGLRFAEAFVCLRQNVTVAASPGDRPVSDLVAVSRRGARQDA